MAEKSCNDVSLSQERASMHLDWTCGAAREGLEHYVAGEFFAAHESWESLWLVAQEPEKMFLQALIQVAAAFHHLQRNNSLGASRLLDRAMARLEHYPQTFASISVDALREDIGVWRRALTAGAAYPDFGSVRIRI